MIWLIRIGIIITVLVLPILWTVWLMKTFKRKNKRLFFYQIIITSSLFLLCILTPLAIKYGYPSDWNKIEFNQDRQTVYRLVGTPTIDFGDVKADIWMQKKKYYWYRLDVIYNLDKKVSAYIITFYFGLPDNYIHWNIVLNHKDFK